MIHVVDDRRAFVVAGIHFIDVSGPEQLEKLAAVPPRSYGVKHLLHRQIDTCSRDRLFEKTSRRPKHLLADRGDGIPSCAVPHGHEDQSHVAVAESHRPWPGRGVR